MTGEQLTPAFQQYQKARDDYPDALVMFRMGDFLEMFYEDAVRASEILGITLTSREMGRGRRYPMAGVPYHAQEPYIARLLAAGLKVAICDQVEEASQAKGVVRREVVRVLTPGTLVEDSFLPERRSNWLVAVSGRGAEAGLACLDLSAARLELEVCSAPALAERLAALDPAELLLPEGMPSPADLVPVSRLPESAFSLEAGEREVRRAMGAATLEGLEPAGLGAALAAAGAALAYARRNRMEPAPGTLQVTVRRSGDRMPLDPATRRNLEIFVDSRGERGGSLMALLDRCITPMGTRLLAAWLSEPLLELGPLQRRQAAVRALAGDRTRRERLKRQLQPVRDLERLLGRTGQGMSSPRDLGALGASLRALSGLESVDTDPVLSELTARAAYRGSLGDLLGRALSDSPPTHLRERGAIRAGFDRQLDEIESGAHAAREYLAALEGRERQRTGIRALKLGFNRVFGYYLEVSHANREPIPEDYIRRQTLTGAERYVTAELKEQETHILSCEARALQREQELIQELAEAAKSEMAALQVAARAAAELDVLASLGEVGSEPGWCAPELLEGPTLDLVEAGHPLVRRSLGAAFVPNSVHLDPERRIMLLTGPNMAGKSTFLRQVGIAVVLAQAGAFVPAREARIGLVDRVFTRVGAADDIARGLSTFMLEMVECAAILHRSTERSLVLIDELGRGTSTYDGVSIARAVIEHLHDSPVHRPLAVVATHFHELTALEAILPALANYRMDVSEVGEEIVFLHRVVAGGADRSYGIHVARLAGIPAQVLVRARQILAELERSGPLATQPQAGGAQEQLALPLPTHPLVERLEQLNLEQLTPLEALNELFRLREQALTV